MVNGRGKTIANVARLHRLMDEEGVSAVVARSGKNFTYLAGFAYPGTLARHLEFPDSPREVLLVWPRQGEPVLGAEFLCRASGPARLLPGAHRGLR